MRANIYLFICRNIYLNFNYIIFHLINFKNCISNISSYSKYKLFMFLLRKDVNYFLAFLKETLPFPFFCLKLSLGASGIIPSYAAKELVTPLRFLSTLSSTILN